VHVDERADPIELRLEPPPRVVERLVRALCDPAAYASEGCAIGASTAGVDGFDAQGLFAAANERLAPLAALGGDLSEAEQRVAAVHDEHVPDDHGGSVAAQKSDGFRHLLGRN